MIKQGDYMRWISEELKFIKENRGTLTNFQMAIILGRREDDVAQALCRFGLKRDPIPTEDNLLTLYKVEREAIATQRREIAEQRGKGLHKIDAVRISRRLIVKGKVKVKPCECVKEDGTVCGETKNVMRHHPDYNKPEEFTFLCPFHHGKTHREINKENRKTN